MKKKSFIPLLALLCLTFSLPLLAQTPQWKDITPPGFTGNYRWCAWANHNTAVASADNGWLYLSIDTAKTFYRWKKGNELRTVGYFRNNVGISIGVDTVLRTTDGGKTWEQLNGFIPAINFCEKTLFHKVYWKTNDSVLVVGTNVCGSNIFLSGDAGKTWIQVADQLSFGMGRYITNLYFYTPAHGYAYAMGYYAETTDGGKTWQKHNYKSDFEGIMSATVLSNGNVLANHVYNGDATGKLVIFPNGDASKEYYVVSTSFSDDGFVCNGETVYANRGTLISTDTAKTWQTISFKSTKDTVQWFSETITHTDFVIQNKNQSLNSMDILSKDTILMVGGDLASFRSTDGAKSWHEYQYGFGSNTLRSICFKNNTVGFIGTVNGRLMRTNDGGVTWSWKNINYKQINDIVFPDENIGFINSGDGSINSGLIRTIDGGNNWSLIYKGNLDEPLFPTKDTGFFVQNGIDLYRTDNKGDSWNRKKTDINGLMKIHFRNAKTGAAISDAYSFDTNIIYTFDYGENWSKKKLGFAPILLNPINNNDWIVFGLRSDITNKTFIYQCDKDFNCTEKASFNKKNGYGIGNIYVKDSATFYFDYGFGNDTLKVCNGDMTQWIDQKLWSGGRVTFPTKQIGYAMNLTSIMKIYYKNTLTINKLQQDYKNITVTVLTETKESVPSIIELRNENSTIFYKTNISIENGKPFTFKIPDSVPSGEYKIRIIPADELYNNTESNYFNIAKTDMESIPTISLLAFPVKGGIQIAGCENAEIYTIQGQLLYTVSDAKSSYIPLSAGIYVVRCGNEVQKVVIQ